MIRKCFKKSWQLTTSNYAAFIQGTILLIVGSALTLGLMFPALVTGLEGMYLKAWRGEAISGKDVFMYRKKFFPLLGAIFRISLEPFLFMALFVALSFALFFISMFLRMPFLNFIGILLLFPVFFVFFIRRQGQYLHVLNLIAEQNMKVSEALRHSRKATQSPWTSAFLFFLYLFVLGLIGLPTWDTFFKLPSKSVAGHKVVHITSINLRDGGFDITWNRSQWSDFHLYNLEKSLEKKMTSSEVVFHSTNRSDTTYRDEYVNPDIHQYYRVAVIDTFEHVIRGRIHPSPVKTWPISVPQILGVLLFPFIVGATAMTYVYDMELLLAFKKRHGPQYTCSNCGELVKHRDTRCWSCGYTFSHTIKSNPPK